MKKRITALMLALLVCLTLVTPAMAKGGLENFKKVKTYNGDFTDLPEGEWYTGYVKTAYEYGLVNGYGINGRYAPGENMEVAQLLTIAARLHCIYTNGQDNLTNGTGGQAWYQPYADYCLQNGIISAGQFSVYETAATRRQFAAVMAKTFPAAEYTPVNTVEDGTVPDVKMTDADAGAIYRLYRAGIVNGSGASKAYLPDTSITRSEVAALLVRMIDPSARVSVTLTKSQIDMSVPVGTTLGSRIADFSFTTYDGTTYSLYETLAEKKMVLLNFWATWCGPCRSEFPVMNETYGEYSDRVEIFALDCDWGDSDSDLADFAAQYGLTFPVGLDAADVYSDFSTSYIPLTVIVDRFGVICMAEVGAQTSADRFRAAFKLFTSDDYTEPVLLDGYPY